MCTRTDTTITQENVKFKITTLEITVNENDEAKEETEGTITYKGNRHGKKHDNQTGTCKTETPKIA